MRLIDADALEPYYRLMQNNETGIKMMALPDGIVDQQPTVDAVHVIRCKDCKYWGADGYRNGCKYATCIMMENDYCSMAERKEE